MQRYFLEISYKGTAYNGFQVQDNANTIQGEVERAFQILFRRHFELTGSSRTDSGVHAHQNYFHFDSEEPIASSSMYNLNALLPNDIAIRGLYPVNPEAHCRFDAVYREYHYHIYTKKNPFLFDRAWQYVYPIDKAALQLAAEMVLEYVDFTSFAKRNAQVKTHNCQLLVSEWVTTDNGLLYRVRANRFLRGMVRALVATMLKVGRGQISITDFRSIMEAKNNNLSDFSAPPQGLFLNRVQFEGNLSKTLLQENL